jgi:hypothetical protein
MITLEVKKHCFHFLDPRFKLRLPKDDGRTRRTLFKVLKAENLR